MSSVPKTKPGARHQNMTPVTRAGPVPPAPAPAPALQMSPGEQLLSDLLNNNRAIPRVSIKSTAQLCLNQEARVFPYMEVSRQLSYSITFSLITFFCLHKSIHMQCQQHLHIQQDSYPILIKGFL